MPILTLQKSMRRLGRIRMGAKTDKNFPRKLETWRMTSPSRDLLEAAAVMYGGEVTEWAGSPNGRQWELFTDAQSIEVLIPPGDMAFSQWFELWSGGGCQRRCDGQTEMMSDGPCVCPADPDERIELAAKGKACKPTTRLFVIQPRLPDVGLWHFESHGFYAATEIPGTVNIIQAAAANGTLIPARLRIEARTVKRDGTTNNFCVPVIELPTLTTHTLMSGEMVGEIGPARPELEAGAIAGHDRARGSGQTAQSVENPGVSAIPASNSPATSDAGRPLPKAGSGDGANMRRAILTKAQRVGLDADALDSICRATVGKPFPEITDSAEANKILAALDGKTPPEPPTPPAARLAGPPFAAGEGPPATGAADTQGGPTGGGMTSVPDQAPDGEAQAESVGESLRPPQEPAKSKARRASPKSPGEALHRQLGAMGFDPDIHGELIFAESGGNTVHASELSDGQRAMVITRAEAIQAGRYTVDQLHQICADYRTDHLDSQLEASLAAQRAKAGEAAVADFDARTQARAS